MMESTPVQSLSRPLLVRSEWGAPLPRKNRKPGAWGTILSAPSYRHIRYGIDYCLTYVNPFYRLDRLDFKRNSTILDPFAPLDPLDPFGFCLGDQVGQSSSGGIAMKSAWSMNPQASVVGKQIDPKSCQSQHTRWNYSVNYRLF